MLASDAYSWMVDWVVCISLSGLHSCVDSVRLVIFWGGCTYLLSLVWLWLSKLVYACRICSFVWVLWYCVMRSILCLKRMLSECISSSYLRHCWEIPCGSCHWHRYIRFMACAPHLSFRVLVLSLIIFWMGCPSVDCEMMGGVLEVCVSWGRAVDVVGVWVGNNFAACWRASLISFGACLYLAWNSWEVTMAFVSGFLDLR